MEFYQWILLLRLLIPLIYLNRFDRYNTVKIILINRPDNPAINVYLASFYRQRLSFRESLSRKISAPPVWLDCSPIYRVEISYDRNHCIVLSAMKINSFIRLVKTYPIIGKSFLKMQCIWYLFYLIEIILKYLNISKNLYCILYLIFNII